MVRFQDLVYKCFNLTVRFLFLCYTGSFPAAMELGARLLSGREFSNPQESRKITCIPWTKE